MPSLWLHAAFFAVLASSEVPIASAQNPPQMPHLVVVCEFDFSGPAKPSSFKCTEVPVSPESVATVPGFDPANCAEYIANTWLENFINNNNAVSPDWDLTIPWACIGETDGDIYILIDGQLQGPYRIAELCAGAIEAIADFLAGYCLPETGLSAGKGATPVGGELLVK